MPLGHEEVSESLPGPGETDAHGEQDQQDDVGEGGREVDDLAAGPHPPGQTHEHHEPGHEEEEGQLHLDLAQGPRAGQQARGADVEHGPLPVLLHAGLG